MNDKLVIAGKSYSLAAAGRDRQIQGFRRDAGGDGRQRRGDHHDRDTPQQHRAEPQRTQPAGDPPAVKIHLLPNTAGCYSADDAVRTLRLARELLDGHNLVKLEVLGDPQSLYPNVIETIAAAKTLVAEGFQVMVYTSDDPIVAKQLEDIGCVAIMPLASLIGSGMGILNPWNLQLIMERVQVPVIVDAGVGTASDAAIAMELGCHGVLMNTAIAGAQEPVLMASP